MDKINQPSTQADSKFHDLCPSNSSTEKLTGKILAPCLVDCEVPCLTDAVNAWKAACPDTDRPVNPSSQRQWDEPLCSKRLIEPVDEGVRYYKEPSCYDMSGDKFLLILDQHRFKKTKHFKQKPSTRDGTENDVRRLKKVFYKLGFLIFVLRDYTYLNIIDYLTAIATLDHTRTSCICVTILTHGDKGGKICAADKQYPLCELFAIFEKETDLINKPKLFFVQACRGNRMDAGHTMYLGSQSDSALTMPTYYSSEMPSSSEEERLMMMQDSRQADSQHLPTSKKIRLLLDLFKDSFSADRSDRQSSSVVTVPTHADTLVLYSTVEDFVSYRAKSGTWMIQALCDVIENHHEDLNLLDMITEMNRVVAHERITSNSEWKSMNNKKHMPETRFTLTMPFFFTPQYVYQIQ